jgi:hypothetical protein
MLGLDKCFTKTLGTFLQVGELGRNPALQTRELLALVPNMECFRLLFDPGKTEAGKDDKCF